jgi:hypothetical protein
MIDVSARPAELRLNRAPGRNFAVIGTAKETEDVLTTAGLSLGRQHTPGDARFSIVYLNDDAAASAEQLQKDLGRHNATVYDISTAKALLNETASAVAAGDIGKPHYMIVYGVDGGRSVLAKKPEGSPKSPLDSFKTILKEGPECRTHVLGSWSSVTLLKETAPLNPQEIFRAWMATNVQGSELSPFANATSPAAKWHPRSHRAIYFDANTHQKPVTVIPYDTAT